MALPKASLLTVINTQAHVCTGVYFCARAGKGSLTGLSQERQFKLHLPIYPVEFTFLLLQSDELKAQALL